MEATGRLFLRRELSGMDVGEQVNSCSSIYPPLPMSAKPAHALCLFSHASISFFNSFEHQTFTFPLFGPPRCICPGSNLVSTAFFSPCNLRLVIRQAGGEKKRKKARYRKNRRRVHRVRFLQPTPSRTATSLCYCTPVNTSRRNIGLEAALSSSSSLIVLSKELLALEIY